MAILGFELEEIARLLALVEAQGLEEFVLEEAGRYLRIRGPRPPKAPRPVWPAPEVGPSPAPPSRPPKARKAITSGAAKTNGAPDTLPADQIVLASPTIGTFYRADKPGAPPLIEVGQHISVGQTIGLIEAMKVFSEIPAEHAGTVVAIPAQDGQLVHAGTPLMILRKDEG